jgi:hypothetical protein
MYQVKIRFLQQKCKYILFLILTFKVGLLNSQVVFYPLTTQAGTEYSKLKEEFKKVPDENKLRNFWFWLNGVATKESITRDLEAMKEKGYGGALIGDNGAPTGPVGPTFMGKEWLELFAHAVKEADRLGIELSINIQSGFGDAGNPNIQPDNGMKKIVFSEIKVTGPKKLHEKFPVPPSKIYYKDIAIQAYTQSSHGDKDTSGIKNWSIKSMNKRVPSSKEKDVLDMMINYDEFPDNMGYTSVNPDQITDLSGFLSDGILTWDVPPGDWTITRYGMTSTGKLNDYASPGYKGGLCYDQINRRGIEAQWKDVALPLLETARKSGKSLKFVHTDSWEMGMTNWTQDFMEEFQKLRGYNLSPYLPVLTDKIVGSREESDRFLEDFRQTIGDLVADQNYAVLGDLAHTDGVLLHSEAAGPGGAPVDGLQTLGRNDIPMGEFWPRSDNHRITDGQRFAVKQASCAAHIYGKRFCAAEGPTTIGPAWERSPGDLKHDIDRAFCNGVNRLFWHTYTSSPDETGIPGIEYFAGTHLNRKVTWWDQSVSFIDYLNRSQFLLSQGLYCANILGYYGTGVPRYVFLEKDIKDVPEGYAWDMCNSEVLLTRASVKNSRIFLPDGMNYSMLTLTDQKDISLPVLRKIEQMVKEGMVLVGPPPVRASGLTGYPASDQEVKAIVKRLWGDIDQKNIFVNNYGKGKVYCGKSVAEVLKIEKIAPDFDYNTASDEGLWYIHRSAGDAEIYFIVNKWAKKGINDFMYRNLPGLPDRYVKALCSFRVEGEREIEQWDPVTGEMTPVVAYTYENNSYKIPVTLAPEGSTFFVFRKSPERKHITDIKINGVDQIDGNSSLVYNPSGTHVNDNSAEISQAADYHFTWSNGEKTKIVTKKIPGEQVLDGKWKVHFNEKPVLGNSFDIEVDSLKSWTEFSQRSVRYFSGTASYTKEFNLPAGMLKDGRVYIDLGDARDLATIKINGKEVAICWKFPYRADITDYLKNGKNNLNVDVTNLWCNRLIGDGKLPQEERLTRTNIKKFDAPDAEKYLRASGLLGPVKLQFSQIHKLNP